MAVGNIFEADHANSILMAGRADLVCLARPHLANPFGPYMLPLSLVMSSNYGLCPMGQVETNIIA